MRTKTAAAVLLLASTGAASAAGSRRGELDLAPANPRSTDRAVPR
ncbi:hypothetical protein [Allokutzneria oryzae]|uniref:Uncharacterized protein n=1 Tax=Allokutzneria oryzae TaxID=1378989 RepID=A0ABV6A181_9PSEU